MRRDEINDMVTRLVAMGLDEETIAFFVRAALQELMGNIAAPGAQR